MSKPLDKILCGGKFYRYVVACMHNCPQPHHCREFWEFFNAIGKTPAEYYNEDGIGEKVMRRTVFDCDRCGKRDLLEVYGLYNLAGETADDRLDDVARGDMVVQAGYADEHIQRITFIMLDQLEEAREWQHYCRACFKDVADGISRMLKPPSQRTRKRSKLTPAKLAGKKPEPKPEPEPEPEIDPAEPELEVVVIPAEAPAPAPAPEKEAAGPEAKATRAGKASKAKGGKEPAAKPKARGGRKAAKDKEAEKEKPARAKAREEAPQAAAEEADDAEAKPKKRGRKKKAPTGASLKL